MGNKPSKTTPIKSARLRGQDKATLRSPLAALARVCLHIGFSTLGRHSSGTLQGA